MAEVAEALSFSGVSSDISPAAIRDTPPSSLQFRSSSISLSTFVSTANPQPQDAWLPITASRNGVNAYYAAFHILCSGIGIHGLVLPVAFTALGCWCCGTWGIRCLTLAFIWQLYTIYLLVQLHESAENRMRYSRYFELCSAAFGHKISHMLLLFPIIDLSAGTCMPLTVIGGSTMNMFFGVLCQDICISSRPLSTVEWYLVFTSGTVVLSQLPNLNSIAGVSLNIGAISSVSYYTLLWAVPIAEGRLPKELQYYPVQASTQTSRALDVINALGIIVFSFRGHNLILEIQATMPSNEKRPSRVPMWKGVKSAYLLIGMCLFLLSIGGYWSYGHMIPKEGGMLIALYMFHGRETSSRHVQGLTSLLFILSAVSSFPIYAMPVFDSIESVYTSRNKKSCPWWLRAIFRVMFGFLCLFLAVATNFMEPCKFLAEGSLCL